MGDPVTATLIAATTASAGAGIMQAGMQRQAGQQQAIELKQQALQEEDAARDRELTRRRRLVRALSTQIASAGAQGLDIGSGSLQSIALTSGQRADEETAIDRAMTAQRQRSLRRQASSARRIGNLRAATTLLSTAADAGKSGAAIADR